MSSYKHAKLEVRSAADDAADVIEAAVNRIRALRERSRSTREWDLASAKLDREGIEARLNGVMNQALDELEKLESEHDLAAKDMQQNDVILIEIDELLAGRIGDPYTIDKLRAIVDEAILFRYPNEIPPGFLDSDKPTPLLAAGDVILWRQVMDKAASLAEKNRRVLLITNDRKADWWILDKKEKPIKARPELSQELRRESEADLLLLTFADFIDGAREYLASTVSESTVDQLRTTPPVDYDSNSDDAVDLLRMHPFEFDVLIDLLMFNMGYSSTKSRQQSGDVAGHDLFTIKADENDPLSRITVLVEVKQYRRAVGIAIVRETYGMLMDAGADRALIFTTSYFAPEARRFAQDKPIDLIDGPRLLDLLLQHLHYSARIG